MPRLSGHPRFKWTLFEWGELVKDYNPRFGYVVGGRLVYKLNCADAANTQLK